MPASDFLSGEDVEKERIRRHHHPRRPFLAPGIRPHRQMRKRVFAYVYATEISPIPILPKDTPQLSHWTEAGTGMD